jgi:hypothetical protein
MAQIGHENCHEMLSWFYPLAVVAVPVLISPWMKRHRTCDE